MLNDLSQFTRRAMFSGGIGSGLTLGVVFLDSASAMLAFALSIGGTLLIVAGVLVFTSAVRRLEVGLVTDIDAASMQMIRGEVAGVYAPARTVRSRVRGSTYGYVSRWAQPIAPPTVLLVATALAPDGPRRVACLVPASVGLNLRKAPIALWLHPTVREAAILDDSVDVNVLARIDADPRWSSADIPTEGSVAGGWPAIIAASIGGILTGFVLVAVIAAMAG